VLGTANGLGTAAIMRAAGVSKTAVLRWQARFMDEGLDGLVRDRPERPAGRACLRMWPIGSWP
jgi:transposase